LATGTERVVTTSKEKFNTTGFNKEWLREKQDRKVDKNSERPKSRTNENRLTRTNN